MRTDCTLSRSGARVPAHTQHPLRHASPRGASSSTWTYSSTGTCSLSCLGISYSSRQSGMPSTTYTNERVVRIEKIKQKYALPEYSKLSENKSKYVGDAGSTLLVLVTGTSGLAILKYAAALDFLKGTAFAEAITKDSISGGVLVGLFVAFLIASGNAYYNVVQIGEKADREVEQQLIEERAVIARFGRVIGMFIIKMRRKD